MIPLADPGNLVGRQRELVGLQEAFETRTQLVTVTGPTGVGKSRLASEYLHSSKLVRRTVAVDLSAAARRRDLLGTVAAAVAAPAAAPSAIDPVHVIAHAIGDLGPALILLDQFGAVVDHARDVLPVWLARCPEARFLVTCEQPLRLAEEQVFELAPLDVPGTDLPARRSAALRLWYQVRHEPLPEMPDPQVVKLVQALEGLPLSIELAAQHAGSMERLLAAVSSRDAPPMDLADALWAGLPPEQQEALRQLSTFVGGFTPGAAQQVLDIEGDSGQALEALKAAHLVQPHHNDEGDKRLAIHFTIRSYARHQLHQTGRRSEVRRRHARWAVGRGQALGAALEGPEGPEALRALGADQLNLRAVVRRHGDPSETDPEDRELALAALCIREYVLATYGPVDADLPELRRLIPDEDDRELSAEGVAEALCVRCISQMRLGQLEPAQADIERAVGLSEQHFPEREAAVRVGVVRAFVLLRAGEAQLAERTAADAEALAVRIEDRTLEGIASGMRGLVKASRSDRAGALAATEHALQLHREVRNWRYEGIALTRLASLHLEAGEEREAQETARAARALHRRFDDRSMTAVCLGVESAVAHAQGELSQAREALEAAIPMHRAIGDRAALSRCLARLGLVRFELGDVDAAARLLDDAIDRLRSEGDRDRAMLTSAYRGAVGASLGEVEAAERLLGAALDALGGAAERAVVELLSVEIDLAMARSSLEPEPHLRTARERVMSAGGALQLVNSQGSHAERAELRTALRIAQTGLAAHRRRDLPEGAPTLSLPRNGIWFVGPAGVRFELASEPAVRRLLSRLAWQARSAPGRPQSPTELIAAGWPGAQMAEDTATHHLHVCLNRLRSRGVDDLLCANEAGYFLDPGVDVRFVEDRGDWVCGG